MGSEMCIRDRIHCGGLEAPPSGISESHEIARGRGAGGGESLASLAWWGGSTPPRASTAWVGAMAERTLLLCKSESLSRGLTFEVAERFERRGLHMIGCRMLTPTAEQAQRWRERGGSQTRSALPLSPLVAMVWGGEDAVAAGLEIVGEAEMSLAAHGTVRADLALTPEALEVSASAKEAENEIGLFFSEQELAEDEGKAAMPAGKGKGAAPTATSPKADLPSAAAPKAASAPEPAAQPKQPAATPAVAEGMSKAQLKKDAKKAEKAAKKAAHKGTPVPSISYDPPSGTRDFFPDQMRVRTWLFNKFKEVARQLAFVEYDAPVLEAEQLYVRKGGEEITGQMYNFVDKDGKRVSLRPEMTPTLARMILSLGGKVLLPVKWFSIPQCWRFETVQRGRKREHFQWNMDIIGARCPSSLASHVRADFVAPPRMVNVRGLRSLEGAALTPQASLALRQRPSCLPASPHSSRALASRLR